MKIEDLIIIIDKLDNEEICTIFNDDCTKCPFKDKEDDKCAIQNLISRMHTYKFKQKYNIYK